MCFGWKSAVRPCAKAFHRFHLGRTRIAIATAEYGDVRVSPPGRGGAPALLQNLLVRRSRTAHCSQLACSIEPTSVYGSRWAERAEYEERVARMRCCDASAALCRYNSRLYGMSNIRIAKHLICTSDSNLKRVEFASCSCDAATFSLNLTRELKS